MTKQLPLALVWLPQQSVVRDLSLVTGGVCLTALSAQVQIPWQPVPFTLQTLAVMICGLGLGKRLGFLSQAVYVGLGAAGVPLYAGLAGGASKLTGATGGYLVSFLVVSFVLGALAERGWTSSLWKTALAFAIGIVINLGLGTAWLAASIGWKAAFVGGCLPFVGIEILKAAVVAPLLPGLQKLARESA